MQTRHIGSVTFFTRAQLEANNPSRREGIDAVAEARWRSTTSKLVKAAVKTLKLPDWVYETAMNYINRFFLTRSISKNDRHLVVGGAMLLASKVQESPRSVQDVAYVLLQLKNANKQKAQQGPDQTTLEQFMEGVVLAEQAVLFSLNFNLNVETHVSLARRLLEPLDLWAKTNPAPEEAEANQLKLSLYGAVMFFLNDSALTNLSLQYPNCKVAPVALVMAAKRIAAARYSGKVAPAALQRVLALANDAEWFKSKGLTLEAAADIEAQILELYATSPAQPAAGASQPQQRQQQQALAQASQHPPSAPVAGLSHSAAPQHGGDPSAQRQQQSAEGHADPVASAAYQRPQQQQRPAGTGAGLGAAHAAAGEQLAAQAPATASAVADGRVATTCTDRLPGGPDDATASVLQQQHPGSPSPGAFDGVSSGAGAGLTQCGGGQGQPSSSAAALPAGGMTAEGTPELPHPPFPQHVLPDMGASHERQQQHVLQQQQQQLLTGCRKRRSDADDCTAGDQQATSELHEAPVLRPEAEARGAQDADPACGGGGDDGACNGNDDSANENCSPDGLTTGNASGSGCGVADGQPEVCSRPDAEAAPGLASCQQSQMQSRPSEPQLASSAARCRGGQAQPQQCAKRCRAALGGEGRADEAYGGCEGALFKARRMEEAQPVAMQP